MKVTVGEPDLDVSIKDRLQYKGIKMSSVDDIETSSTSTPRRRGRPPATQTTITRRLLNEDDEENNQKKDDLVTFANLFAADPEGDINQDIVMKVRVNRSDPNEGMLGYIEDMEATEQTIYDKWGGSTYLLHGLNSKGKIVRVRTIKIAGDPVFEGEAAEISYRKSKGLPPKASVNQNSMSPQDVMAMIEARDERRRLEEKERAEERKKEIEERRREERELDDRRRKDEQTFILEREKQNREFEERKRKDEEERERRRREDDRDREERRRKDLLEEQQKQQQFFTMMMQMTQQQAAQTLSFVKESASNKNSSDPTEALIKGVQLVLSIKEGLGNGDSEEDLLQTVVKNLPSMLNAAGNAVGKAINEVKGNNKQIITPVSNPAGGLQLPPGELSTKFATIITKIREQGGNPEIVLSSIADRILQPVMAAENPKPVVMDPGKPKAVLETKDVTLATVVEEKKDNDVIRIKLGKKELK